MGSKLEIRPNLTGKSGLSTGACNLFTLLLSVTRHPPPHPLPNFITKPMHMHHMSGSRQLRGRGCEREDQMLNAYDVI